MSASAGSARRSWSAGSGPRARVRPSSRRRHPGGRGGQGRYRCSSSSTQLGEDRADPRRERRVGVAHPRDRSRGVERARRAGRPTGRSRRRRPPRAASRCTGRRGGTRVRSASTRGRRSATKRSWPVEQLVQLTARRDVLVVEHRDGSRGAGTAPPRAAASAALPGGKNLASRAKPCSRSVADDGRTASGVAPSVVRRSIRDRVDAAAPGAAVLVGGTCFDGRQLGHRRGDDVAQRAAVRALRRRGTTPAACRTSAHECRRWCRR